MPNLTKRTVDASSPTEKEYFVWCAGTPGFGVRVHPTGKKVFIAQVRVGRQTRRLRIGPYGVFTVDQARIEAQEIIRKASLGKDPQREPREARAAITVGELCDIYMEAARSGLVLTRFRVPKRGSTVAIDEGRVSRHIKPLIGSTLAQDLTRADVQRMVDQIGTFHFSAQGQISWCDFAREIVAMCKEGLPSKVTVRPIPSSAYRTTAERPRYSVLDCSKLKSAYNIDQPERATALAHVLKELSQ